MKNLQISETILYVDNINQAELFYSKVLKLTMQVKKKNHHVFFYCGNSMLLIFNPKKTATQTGQIPAHGANGPGHVAFEIEDKEYKEWKKQLVNNGVAIESEVHWPDDRRSVYFRDPAGNSLEFITPIQTPS